MYLLNRSSNRSIISLNTQYIPDYSNVRKLNNISNIYRSLASLTDFSSNVTEDIIKMNDKLNDSENQRVITQNDVEEANEKILARKKRMQNSADQRGAVDANKKKRRRGRKGKTSKYNKRIEELQDKMEECNKNNVAALLSLSKAINSSSEYKNSEEIVEEQCEIYNILNDLDADEDLDESEVDIYDDIIETTQNINKYSYYNPEKYVSSDFLEDAVEVGAKIMSKGYLLVGSLFNKLAEGEEEKINNKIEEGKNKSIQFNKYAEYTRELFYEYSRLMCEKIGDGMWYMYNIGEGNILDDFCLIVMRYRKLIDLLQNEELSAEDKLFSSIYETDYSICMRYQSSWKWGAEMINKYKKWYKSNINLIDFINVLVKNKMWETSDPRTYYDRLEIVIYLSICLIGSSVQYYGEEVYDSDILNGLKTMKIKNINTIISIDGKEYSDMRAAELISGLIPRFLRYSD